MKQVSKPLTYIIYLIRIVFCDLRIPNALETENNCDYVYG